MTLGTPGPSPRGAKPFLQPGFAGIATFLRAGQVSVDALPAGLVSVSGIPLDGVADTPGTADDPRAIREASVAFLASLLPSMRGTLVEVETARRVGSRRTCRSSTWATSTRCSVRTRSPTRSRHAAIVAREASAAVFFGGTRAITLPLLDGVARGRGRVPALLRLGATLDLADEASDRPMAPEAALRGVARRGAAAACLGVQGWQPAAEWRRAVETGFAVTPLADWRQHGLAATARVAAQALLRRADGSTSRWTSGSRMRGFAAGRGRVLSGACCPRSSSRLRRPSRVLSGGGRRSRGGGAGARTAQAAPSTSRSGRCSRSSCRGSLGQKAA